jgi:hypothetical protein
MSRNGSDLQLATSSLIHENARGRAEAPTTNEIIKLTGQLSWRSLEAQATNTST